MPRRQNGKKALLGSFNFSAAWLPKLSFAVGSRDRERTAPAQQVLCSAAKFATVITKFWYQPLRTMDPGVIGKLDNICLSFTEFLP